MGKGAGMLLFPKRHPVLNLNHLEKTRGFLRYEQYVAYQIYSNPHKSADLIGRVRYSLNNLPIIDYLLLKVVLKGMGKSLNCFIKKI